jgi:hypothetical protein
MRLCWLVLAGCSVEGSIEVRVMPPSGGTVDSVHLFTGALDPHDEPIQPARGALAPTVWWKRDSLPDFDIQPMARSMRFYRVLTRRCRR